MTLHTLNRVKKRTIFAIHRKRNANLSKVAMYSKKIDTRLVRKTTQNVKYILKEYISWQMLEMDSNNLLVESLVASSGEA